MKFRTRVTRNANKPLLLLLTAEEHEYLQRLMLERGGKMGLYLRGLAFKKGWKRVLETMRQEQGSLQKSVARPQ